MRGGAVLSKRLLRGLLVGVLVCLSLAIPVPVAAGDVGSAVALQAAAPDSRLEYIPIAPPDSPPAVAPAAGSGLGEQASDWWGRLAQGLRGFLKGLAAGAAALGILAGGAALAVAAGLVSLSAIPVALLAAVTLTAGALYGVLAGDGFTWWKGIGSSLLAGGVVLAGAWLQAGAWFAGAWQSAAKLWAGQGFLRWWLRRGIIGGLSWLSFDGLFSPDGWQNALESFMYGFFLAPLGDLGGALVRPFVQPWASRLVTDMGRRFPWLGRLFAGGKKWAGGPLKPYIPELKQVVGDFSRYAIEQVINRLVPRGRPKEPTARPKQPATEPPPQKPLPAAVLSSASDIAWEVGELRRRLKSDREAVGGPGVPSSPPPAAPQPPAPAIPQPPRGSGSAVPAPLPVPPAQVPVSLAPPSVPVMPAVPGTYLTVLIQAGYTPQFAVMWWSWGFSWPGMVLMPWGWFGPHLYPGWALFRPPLFYFDFSIWMSASPGASFSGLPCGWGLGFSQVQGSHLLMAGD